MTSYQLTWILPGKASQGELDSSLQQIEERVKQRNGKFQKSPYLWEHRTLAFPIEKHETGHYCVAQFSMDGGKLASFEEDLKADADILRYLLIRA